MATSYPGGLDSLPRPSASDTMDDTAGGKDGPAVIDNLSDAVEAVQAELGLDPAGAFATVAARLLAIESAVALLNGSPTPTLYGPMLAMDAIGNLQVGGTDSGVANTWASFRFRADESGDLSYVSLYWIDESSPGYGGGTGGTVRVSIEQDNGGIPLGWFDSSGRLGSGSPLGYVDVVGPVYGLANNHAFTSVPTLDAGGTYHVVLSNIDAAPTTNYVSVNSSWMFTPDTPRQPEWPTDDFAALQYWTGGSWHIREEATPIVDLEYSSGGHQGSGYYQVLGVNPTINSTTHKVRARWQVAGGTRSVVGATVRVGEVASAGTDALTVTLAVADGATLGSFTVAEADIPDASNADAEAEAGAWVSGTFSSSVTLTNGDWYDLILSTGSGTTYFSRAMYNATKGYTWGDEVCFNAIYQYTTNSGTDWSYVDGSSWTQMQFYLTEG